MRDSVSKVELIIALSAPARSLIGTLRFFPAILTVFVLSPYSRKMVFRLEKNGFPTRERWFSDSRKMVFRLEKNGFPTREE